MKNKSFMLKITPFLLVVAVIFAGYLYINDNGNPLNAPKLNKQSDLYMQENYPEIWENVYRSADAYFVNSEATQFDEASNSYKYYDGTWQVYYTDNDDEFTYMYLVYDRDCNLIYDSYKDRYLRGYLIFEKFQQEYSNYIQNIFNEEFNNGVPKHTITMSLIPDETHFEGYFYMERRPLSHIDYYTGPVLDINKEYIMEDLAKEYGHVDFRFYDDIKYDMNQEPEAVKESYKAAVDNLYKRCVEVKAIVEKYEIPFKNISITHELFEGLINITYDQLFCDDLYQFVYDNYTVI